MLKSCSSVFFFCPLMMKSLSLSFFLDIWWERKTTNKKTTLDNFYPLLISLSYNSTFCIFYFCPLPQSLWGENGCCWREIFYWPLLCFLRGEVDITLTHDAGGAYYGLETTARFALSYLFDGVSLRFLKNPLFYHIVLIFYYFLLLFSSSTPPCLSPFLSIGLYLEPETHPLIHPGC